MSDIPEIRSPLKWNGDVYGSIIINSDGTFNGKIDSSFIHELLVAHAQNGTADGLLLSFHPAKRSPSV